MTRGKLHVVAVTITAIACGLGQTGELSRAQELEFKLLLMSHGVTKSGASWGGKTYETPDHTRVYLTIVHLDSGEKAKREYDEKLKSAVKIVHQGGAAQEEPAAKTDTAESRAIIVVAATRECKEATAIVATAGRALRIIQSCSAQAALEFERRANRNESLNDRYIYR